MPTTYEFPTLSAQLQAPKLRESAGSTAQATGSPWVHASDRAHARVKGFPSPRQREVAAVALVRSHVSADQALLADKISAVSSALDRLDTRIDTVVAAFESHVTSSTAASVLIESRLAQLGLR